LQGYANKLAQFAGIAARHLSSSGMDAHHVGQKAVMKKLVENYDPTKNERRPMMKRIKAFLESIYLGDRYCEKIEIKDDKISVQINCISRVKKGTKEWNYYSDEDIEHGCLVFDEVVEFISNSELVINGDIEIDVVEKKDDIYSFIVYGCNISDEAISTDIELQIKAKKFYIFNPVKMCNITE